MLNITFEVTPTPQPVIRSESNPRNQAAMIAANNAISNIQYNQRGLLDRARRYYNRDVQTYNIYEFLRHTTISNYDELTNELSGNAYRYFSRRVAIALADLVDELHRLCDLNGQARVAELIAQNERQQRALESANALNERQQAEIARLRALINQVAEHYIMDDHDAAADLLEGELD